MRFRVLTFNTLKLAGRVPPDRVMDRMLALQPDLLLLQEVFNTRLVVPGLFRARNAERLLRRRFEASFHLSTRRTSGPPGFLRQVTFGRFHDGLMIAARKALWDFDREAAHRLPSPAFAGRWVQAVRLAEKGGARSLLVANTHLSAGSKDRVHERRVRQAAGLVGFLLEQESSEPPAAVVLGGDFNAHDNQDEIRTVVLDETTGTSRFRDCFREAEPDQPGFTFSPANTLSSGRVEADARFDYLFVRPTDPEAVAVRSAEVVLDRPDPDTGHNLSDHYGVLAELEIV